MHGLLAKIFKKRGIKDVSELDDTPMPDGSPTEKEKFERWQQILSEGEITVEKIEDFLNKQRENIENKMADVTIPKEQRMELLPYLMIYKALLGLIKAPKAEKESLEKYLQQLLK